jgi:hypothetical protein
VVPGSLRDGSFFLHFLRAEGRRGSPCDSDGGSPPGGSYPDSSAETAPRCPLTVAGESRAAVSPPDVDSHGHGDAPSQGGRAGAPADPHALAHAASDAGNAGGDATPDPLGYGDSNSGPSEPIAGRDGDAEPFAD